MEEDIKILEQFAKYNKYYKEIDGRITMTIDLPLKLDLDKAIENLLKRYKELEEENKQAEKWLNYYKLGETPKEFEELFGNVPFEDIEKIKKWLFNNYIPISVIQNKKKEEREKCVARFRYGNDEAPLESYKYKYTDIDMNEYAGSEIMRVLQELLEERNK